jgi:hypothetical protein
MLEICNKNYEASLNLVTLHQVYIKPLLSDKGRIVQKIDAWYIIKIPLKSLTYTLKR